MKRRPWILVILAVLHFLSPLGNFYLNATWARIPFFEYISHFLQPQNLSRQWPHLVLPIVAGLAIYACKKWSFFVYLLSMLGLLIVTYFGYIERASSLSVFSIVIVFSLNIFIVTYFLVPAVRRVYFDPRLRWWESMPRYSCEITANIKDKDKDYIGKVANFSEGGLFFQPNYLPADNAPIIISFNYENVPYDFNGTVIHHGQKNLVGFGVKFVHSLRQKQNAGTLARILADQGKLIKSRTSQDEDFIHWLKKALKTGKGFLPEINKRS